MKRFSLLAMLFTLVLAVNAQVNKARTEFHFGNDNNVVDVSVGDNAQQLLVLDSIARDFEKVRTQDRYVIINSYTSPDGTEAINEEVALRRARTVEKLFDSKLGADAHVIYRPHYYGWDEIKEMMAADSLMPQRDSVQHLMARLGQTDTLDTEKGSLNLIKAIKAIDRGSVYRYMASHYFVRQHRVTLEVRYLNGAGYSLPAMSQPTDAVKSDKPELPVEIQKPEPLDSVKPLQPIVPVLKDSTTISGEVQRFGEPATFWQKLASNLALKTNLLYDAALVPNIGLEYRINDHFSVAADWMYAWWSRRSGHRYWRVYGGDVEVKYWFQNLRGGQNFTGHHVGAYAGMLTYDVEWGGTGYMGEKWSTMFGLSYGYGLPLSKRLNLDFEIGIGYFGGEYYEYEPQNGKYYWTQTKNRRWFGPTRLEATLVWLLGKKR